MLVADDLLNAARDQTGLDDFGNDYFREGLDKLLLAARTEIKLNERGRAAVGARVIAYLVNRLEIEHWYRIHPEIEDEQILAPVFGLGLPRTGSTALQCLMAEDPAVRSLRAWESDRPCPPPATETEGTDPRIAATEASLSGFGEMTRLAPELQAMLPLNSARDPTECQDLLGLSFRSQAFIATVLFSYIDWLAASDMEPAYRYHKRALKLLQWRCPPKRWRLKSPVHMLNLSALNLVYPDARFVVTHRDVADSIPSIATLIAAMGGLFANDLDLRAIGSGSARLWRKALDRMDSFRDSQDRGRFYDIGFHTMQADPIGTVRDLYAWLGELFTPAFEERMRRWRDTHPKDTRGAKVDPSRFGFAPDTLRSDYARYLDRYRTYIVA